MTLGLSSTRLEVRLLYGPPGDPRSRARSPAGFTVPLNDYVPNGHVSCSVPYPARTCSQVALWTEPVMLVPQLLRPEPRIGLPRYSQLRVSHHVRHGSQVAAVRQELPRKGAPEGVGIDPALHTRHLLAALHHLDHRVLGDRHRSTHRRDDSISAREWPTVHPEVATSGRPRSLWILGRNDHDLP
jgi:hypothetical protein